MEITKGFNFLMKAKLTRQHGFNGLISTTMVNSMNNNCKKYGLKWLRLSPQVKLSESLFTMKITGNMLLDCCKELQILNFLYFKLMMCGSEITAQSSQKIKTQASLWFNIGDLTVGGIKWNIKNVIKFHKKLQICWASTESI